MFRFNFARVFLGPKVDRAAVPRADVSSGRPQPRPFRRAASCRGQLLGSPEGPPGSHPAPRRSVPRPERRPQWQLQHVPRRAARGLAGVAGGSLSIPRRGVRLAQGGFASGKCISCRATPRFGSLYRPGQSVPFGGNQRRAHPRPRSIRCGWCPRRPSSSAIRLEAVSRRLRPTGQFFDNFLTAPRSRLAIAAQFIQCGTDAPSWSFGPPRPSASHPQPRPARHPDRAGP